MTVAIITGISGQDGHWMARRLAEDGVAVIGLSTDIERARNSVAGLSNVAVQAFDYRQENAFADVLDASGATLIFNFAALATGQGMFDAPWEMGRLNGGFVLDILEAMRTSSRRHSLRFVQASSSEMFGQAETMPQSERTAMVPKSPYGCAKLYAHHMVGVYRATYALHASSAILYNHESIRRSTQFVTRKISASAAAISLGRQDTLELGSLTISRDWGYAPEYMAAMLRMAASETPDDYVVGTGRLHSIGDVVELAFSHVGLDWRRYVKINPAWVRPIESIGLCADPRRIFDGLGWRAEVALDEIIAEMVDLDLVRLAAASQPASGE